MSGLTSHPLTSDVAAVVLAAGASTRMGPGQPKALRLLAGRALYRWSLEGCLAGVRPRHAVLVVPAAHVDAIAAAVRGAQAGTSVRVVAGGPTRAASSRAALEGLDPAIRWVLVHDAARPFASPALHAAVLAAARVTGAATAAVEAVDALRYRTPPPRGPLYLDRGNVVRVQTPQAFRRDWLQAAQADADADAAPDDAALVTALGHPVALVPGEPGNDKITVPQDLERAAHRLDPGPGPGRGPTGVRVGTGWDLHRLVGGRALRLGGVEIPHPSGLAGHSDGDVVCHAVADALLGAVGLGDLGTHFPPGDPAWAGVSGPRLLAEVAARLAAEGYAVGNVDVTVMAEAPRLGPHREAMQEAMAWALYVSPNRVSVKAHTAEGLGPVGAARAIAAQAVVLVQTIP